MIRLTKFEITKPPTKPMAKKWTPERIKELKELFPTMSSKDLAAHFGTTADNIRHITSKYGLYRQQHPKWTENEYNILRQQYCSKSAEELAALINRSVSTVRTRLSILKISKRRKWFRPTDEQKLWLQCNYSTMSVSECAAQLGVHSITVSRLARRLGLSRSK